LTKHKAAKPRWLGDEDMQGEVLSARRGGGPEKYHDSKDFDNVGQCPKKGRKNTEFKITTCVEEISQNRGEKRKKEGTIQRVNPSAVPMPKLLAC